MTLPHLIEELEKATGPDRMLDKEIGEYLGWKVFAAGVATAGGDPHWVCNTPMGRGALPAFTSSIDAALTLVPEGYGFYLRGDYSGAGAGLSFPDAYNVTPGHVEAATPAIALCIAALRARQEEGS